MRTYRTQRARERERARRLEPDPDERAALLLARIHDAGTELLSLATVPGQLRRLRVPAEQIRGAAMRAAAKLDTLSSARG